MSPNLKSGVIRAVRTYVAVVGPALLSLVTGTGPVSISAIQVILYSGVPAVVAFAWRVFVDPLPVPTLADHTPAPIPVA